jgi:GH15 family glucan-1,4-alpha-glucosidase
MSQAAAAAHVGAPHVLREYALLADGERGVLVGPRGDYAWMCFPRWDSDACFSTLIGGGGLYAVTPAARFVWGGYYEQGLIWRSRWITDDGVVECREALAAPGRGDRAVVLRQVIAREGTVKVNVALDLRTEFGARRATHLRRDNDGVWRARLGDAQVIWAGAAEAEPVQDGDRGRPLVMTLELQPGAVRDLVLVLDLESEPEPPPDPAHAWSATEFAWRDWVPKLECTIGERDAHHSYAVLKGMTGAGGGMVAAATMALPERAREGRNYDYRYVWIRDQCLAGQAVAKSGPHPLLDDAVRFVSARLLEDGPRMVPAYTIAGGAVPDERRLGLPGYPGGTDVVGNWVNKQFQLDAFGDSLLLLAAAAGHDHLDAQGWRAAEIAVDAIEQRWREPDSGIWELEPENWTHSRLICAAGLRAIAARQPSERAARWLALADAIVAETAATAVHPDGRWQRSPGDDRVDAALLIPAIREGMAPDDPRSLATLEAVERELTEDGYCYRYRPDDRPLGNAEGAFVLCGFLLALAWAQQGDAVRATRWFERNRAGCGPAGLMSEEFDVTQRQMRGNLPQAFVHAALLQCAVTLPAAANVEAPPRTRS